MKLKIDFKSKKWTLIVLGACIALILCSVFFSAWIQSCGFSAKVEDLRNKSNRGTISIQASDKDAAANYTVSGSVKSGILITPKNATAATPAPAIVFTHGLYNNREMQLQNGIEMARRGYVVLMLDRAGHGHNDDTASDSPYGLSMLNAAKYLYNLSYVDKGKIAVSGHSMGGSATTNALQEDGVNTSFSVSGTTYNGNTDASLKAGYHMGIISAGLVQANNASTTAYGSNLLGVGIIKASSDEFFFSSTLKEATYVLVAHDSVTKDNYTNYYRKVGDEYVKQTSDDKFVSGAKYYNYTTSGNSVYYLQSRQAVQFVSGMTTAQANALDKWEVTNRAVYATTTDGTLNMLAQPDGNKRVSDIRKGEALATATTSIRAIYEAKETHPMNHFSTVSAGNVVDFFYNVFGTPEGATFKRTTNQTWWLKETFSIFGFIGIFGMLMPITDLLLGTKTFASLKAAEGEIEEAPLLLRKPRKHVSYWLGAVLTAWFSAYSLKHVSTWYSESAMGNVFKATFVTQNDGYIWANIAQIAFWGLLCALFALGITAIIWIINHAINVLKYNDDGLQYDEHPFDGFKVRSLGNAVKTIILGVLLVAIFYGTVQLIWSLTTVDFRFWTFDLRVFKIARIGSYLKYAAWFFVFYMVTSALSKNYRVKDLPEWATIAINVAANVIGIIILLWHHNSYFINQGALWDNANKLFYIACYPIIPCVGFATVIARRLYVRTGNAWLAGIVNTLIMTFIACANTSLVGVS